MRSRDDLERARDHVNLTPAIGQHEKFWERPPLVSTADLVLLRVARQLSRGEALHQIMRQSRT